MSLFVLVVRAFRLCTLFGTSCVPPNDAPQRTASNITQRAQTARPTVARRTASQHDFFKALEVRARGQFFEQLFEPLTEGESCQQIIGIQFGRLELTTSDV